MRTRSRLTFPRVRTPSDVEPSRVPLLLRIPPDKGTTQIRRGQSMCGNMPALAGLRRAGGMALGANSRGVGYVFGPRLKLFGSRRVPERCQPMMRVWSAPPMILALDGAPMIRED